MQFLPFVVRAAVFGLALVLFASSSWADTVYLKNGAYIDGLVAARSANVLTITIGEIGKVLHLRRQDDRVLDRAARGLDLRALTHPP